MLALIISHTLSTELHKELVLLERAPGYESVS